MNKLRTLKWTSMMMALVLVVSSCSEDSEDPKPTASFNSAVDAEDFRIVTFTNTSTNATTYAWDFGDDSGISTEENPTHTYAETGSYDVTLTATSGGSEISVTETVTITAKLSNKMLNGGSAKSWKIKPAAGAFAVGPAVGSDAWWPNGADISGDRPCLFNDEFIFKTGNVYEYDANGDLWAEAYMGYDGDNDDMCKEESTLPENAAAWGSGTHAYTFVSGATNKITVTGTGAFIALPKAKNLAEYTAAPPTTDGSVTYDVVSYTSVGSVETLVITVKFQPGDAGGYWTFTLIHEND